MFELLTGSELARTSGIVAELREMHQSLVVERGEWTIRPAFTTRYAHHYATLLAGSGSSTILAALEAAIDARDPKAARVALARAPST